MIILLLFVLQEPNFQINIDLSSLENSLKFDVEELEERIKGNLRLRLRNAQEGAKESLFRVIPIAGVSESWLNRGITHFKLTRNGVDFQRELVLLETQNFKIRFRLTVNGFQYRDILGDDMHNAMIKLRPK